MIIDKMTNDLIELISSPGSNELTEEEKNNPESMLAIACSDDWVEFRYASDQIKDTKELIIEAIQENPYILLFASDRLRNDREIVKQIVNDWHGKAKWVGANLHQNYEFIQTYPIRLAGIVVRQDDEFCQSLGFKPFDRKAALKVIRSHPGLTGSLEKQKRKISQISPKCWFDKEIVLEAISVSVDFLGFAAQGLKEDLDFITQAIRICRVDAFDYIGEPWTSDKKVMIEAIRIDHDCFSCSSAELQKDTDILIAHWENALDGGAALWQFFEDSDLEEMRDVREPIFKKYAHTYQPLPDISNESYKYKSYEEFLERWRLEEDESYKEFLENWRLDEDEMDSVIQLLRENGKLIEALEGRVLTLLPEIILAAIPTFPDAINYAAPPLRNDPGFLQKAYKLKSVKKVS